MRPVRGAAARAPRPGERRETTTTSRCKVAAAHAASVVLDTEATIGKACDLIAQAGEQDVRLLLFPEVFVPGFPYWINLYPPLSQVGLNVRYARASVEVPGPEIVQVQQAARRAACNVVLGVSERDGGTCYNTLAFVDDEGRYLGKHRKLQPTYAERYVWGQGDGSTLHVFETSAGRVGGLACWEHTMNLARHALILKGEQVHAAAWPGLSTLAGFEQVFDSQVEAMCRSHAVTGQCFVIVAAGPVTQDVLDLMEHEVGPQQLLTPGGGWSAIIHPTTS